jgi:type I restriction enzyme S subunit
VSLYLQSPRGREAIARIRQTSAGQYNVNSENLRKIVFPLVKPRAQAVLVEKALAVQRMAKLTGDELKDTAIEAEFLHKSILREAFAGNL